MNKKHLLLLAICLSFALLLTAAAVYPGGNNHDAHATAFDWRYNYLSNLFPSQAINGAPNASQPWAIGGTILLCACFGYFFFAFSRRIPAGEKGAANMVRYFGLAGALFAMLAFTPYHDIVLQIASTCTLVSMFYITVFMLRTRNRPLILLSVITMLLSYFTNYVYFTQHWLFILPPLQKVGIVMQIVWTLSLYYGVASIPPKKREA